MKFRIRLLLFGVILFMLFVSYKILEPEISGRTLQDYENRQFKKLAVQQHIAGNPISRTQNGSEEKRFQVSDVVEELLRKYRVDYDYQLHDSPWNIAENWFTPRHIHPEHIPELGAVLKAMSKRSIISANVFPKGSQLKLLLYLEGGQKCVFKPKQFERDHIIEGNPYAGADRHNGEIAAFHLGRLLELRRTPLAVGRKINLETEIKAVGKKDLLNTFFSHNNNTCFYGKCLYCKGESTGLCGQGPLMEGTMVLYLPQTASLKLNSHPWRRSYKKGKDMLWEVDNNYCANQILTYDLYANGPRLLDIVDTCVLDYLTGNADRHHYHTVEGYADSMLIILDNGKSFGNPYMDEKSILAPLYQCCMLREKLWHRLLVLQDGVLSAVMQGILLQDPISPVVTQPHLDAMDRRLRHILEAIQDCISISSLDRVLIKDR